MTGTRASLTLVTGGCRSGKSRYAQELALRLAERPVYVATARVLDEEFAARVERHQHDRDERWDVIEEAVAIGALDLSGRVVVIDCLTLWLTNLFLDAEEESDAVLAQVKQELEGLCRGGGSRIVVSNELGMGLHADTRMGRRFVDLQGWVNQFVASLADEVVLMVSGIPVRIKPEGGVPREDI